MGSLVYAGESLLVTLGGDTGHAGETPAHAGDAWLRWVMPGSRWGMPESRWERLLTLGTPGYAGGRLGHAGECLLTLGMPGYAGGRLGHAGGRLVLRSSWFASRVLVYPEDLSACRLWSKVKYASRGPPYIAGSELLSRVFWCESQLLIGSSRSMSIKGDARVSGTLRRSKYV